MWGGDFPAAITSPTGLYVENDGAPQFVFYTRSKHVDVLY